MTESERAVSALMYRHCELIDAGDFAGVATLFEHGIWFMTKEAGSGAAPVRRWLDENIILYDGLPHTKHVTTDFFNTSGGMVLSGTASGKRALTAMRTSPAGLSSITD